MTVAEPTTGAPGASQRPAPTPADISAMPIEQRQEAFAGLDLDAMTEQDRAAYLAAAMAPQPRPPHNHDGMEGL